MTNLAKNPLYINILIPFLDNKGNYTSGAIAELDQTFASLERAANDLKKTVLDDLGDNIPVMIGLRGGRLSNTYCWRLRAKDADRRLTRLNDLILRPALERIHYEQRLVLFAVEQDLLLINANLKIYGAYRSAMEEHAEAKESLMRMPMWKMS